MTAVRRSGLSTVSRVLADILDMLVLQISEFSLTILTLISEICENVWGVEQNHIRRPHSSDADCNLLTTLLATNHLCDEHFQIKPLINQVLLYVLDRQLC